MYMDMHARHQLTLQVLPRYLKADKQGKTKILDEYCANTGYERKYAITKLREYQTTRHVKKKVPGAHKKKRKKVYGADVEAAVCEVWKAYDHICAERLHPNIRTCVQKLIEWNELHISDEVELKLYTLSLGTLKNLLKNVRKQEYGNIGGTTKPGTLLKSEIPLRVGVWNEKECGFLEIDLVAHCGDSAS